MRFLCLYKPDKKEGVPPSQHEMAEMGKLIEEGMKAGWLIATEGVNFGATGVRVHKSTGGKIAVTDGPFAETKEHLAGFYLIEARDLTDAIHVASKIPPAREGSIEVRPVRELSP